MLLRLLLEVERDLAKQRQGMRTDLVKPEVTSSSFELEVGQARVVVAEASGLRRRHLNDF